MLTIDLNPAVAALAAAHAARNGAAETVSLQTGDAADLLTEGAFDAIWTSDVIWPGQL